MAPADSLRRAIPLFRVPASHRAWERLPRVTADLLFDSALWPAPAGVRSGSATERQLLYSVFGFDIDVRLRPRVRGHAYSLVGQILPDGREFLDPDRVQVFLAGPTGALSSLAVTRFGEFMAWEVERGEQTIELLVDSRVCYRFAFVV